MGLIRLIAAPIRAIVRFPLFQFAVVVLIILFLQAASDQSVWGRIFTVLDTITEETVALCAQLFEVKSFTRSGLTAGLMIAYAYLVCLFILFVLRLIFRAIVDLVGWSNAFGLRNTIARERGIAAYRAWVPFERIRPASVSQADWEAAFAWPPGDRPPYPPLRDTDRARYAELRHRGGGDRGAAPGLHAIPGAHLARSRAAHRDELTGPTMIALARDEQKKAPAFRPGF